MAKAKEDAFGQGRDEGFSAGEAPGKIIDMTQGREAFVRSEEYRTSICELTSARCS
ncbi:UNVERIFIED_CONTAM: hypothetical protein Sradi_3206100 [Sesamum radiatum]|uniref:Uncharacterized protein n=1 Tax=Sesamum radiatum TaxID=300843 RepID=A0AAW2RHV1_SESRA